MSLGAYRPQVRNIFMLQGLAVGVIGTVSGLVAGYAISWAAGTYHLIPLDPQVYSVPLRAVRVERLRRRVDRRRRPGHQRRRHADPRARRLAHLAGGYSSLRVAAVVALAAIPDFACRAYRQIAEKIKGSHIFVSYLFNCRVRWRCKSFCSSDSAM